MAEKIYCLHLAKKMKQKQLLIMLQVNQLLLLCSNSIQKQLILKHEIPQMHRNNSNNNNNSPRYNLKFIQKYFLKIFTTNIFDRYSILRRSSILLVMLMGQCPYFMLIQITQLLHYLMELRLMFKEL